MELSPTILVLLVIVLYAFSSIQILTEYERGVIFRLGKLLPQPKGPGVILVLRPIDRIVRMSLRTIVLDVAPQDIITRDNVSVKVNAVVYFRVIDPRRAVVEVENFHYATSQLAQTTLRSVLGQAEMDDLLSERDRLNQQLQTILDSQTDPWGIKVSAVEVKHVDLPQDMQRAMARQAEAEREEARQDHPRGGRTHRLREACAGGRDHRPRTRSYHAPVLADAHGDRVRTKLHDHLPAPDGDDADDAPRRQRELAAATERYGTARLQR